MILTSEDLGVQGVCARLTAFVLSMTLAVFDEQDLATDKYRRYTS